MEMTARAIRDDLAVATGAVLNPQCAVCGEPFPCHLHEQFGCPGGSMPRMHGAVDRAGGSDGGDRHGGEVAGTVRYSYRADTVTVASPVVAPSGFTSTV